jgi:3-oxoacyl-[acyl-carrier protein] reductase
MLRIDDLAGKSILITGANSGIGAAISRAFAEQGACLALHWNSNAAGAQRVLQSVRDAGSVAELIQGDLTRDGEARRLVESAAAALGGLDVLINNAGSLVKRQPFLEADDKWVDAVFDLNARSVIHTCRAAVPHLQRRGGGAIINVGSIAGLDGGGSGAGIYGASKAFVHNLTRHLAREFAAQNIRVNTVSPGVVDTPFHSATPPERMEAMRQSVSMRRIGTPGDCVGAFLFLASRTLSGYVTGQNIHVNGGQVMP